MHKLFTYGSLKRGFHNHHFLEKAQFLASTRTTEYDFFMVSRGFFPSCSRGGDFAISGELYEVDDLILEEIDGLEGNGRFYTREEVLLANGEMAWIYLVPFDDQFNLFGEYSTRFVRVKDGVVQWIHW